MFRAGEEGLALFHVFGLVVTRGERVIAFAEGRIGPLDADPKHLVCRSSEDGGRTWEPLRYVRKSDGERSFANPTPVIAADGRVLLFHAEVFRGEDPAAEQPDVSRLFVMASDDEGTSWSEPEELSSLFEGNEHGWTLHLPGPGHGLRLASGRLVVPVWHRRAVALPVDERRYGVSVLISDDEGVTWQAGGIVPVSPGLPANESRLLERADGTLAVVARYAAGGSRPRIVSVSADAGDSWSEPVLDAAVSPGNSSDAGLARISGEPGSGAPSRVVFSRLDAAERRNLTLALSYDEGATWPYGLVLASGPASYSDVAVLPGIGVGVLFGRDLTPGMPESFSREVVFAGLDLRMVTGGADDGTAVSSGYHGVEAEELTFEAGLGARWEVVRDATASQGGRVEITSTAPGGFAEAAFEVPVDGSYELYLRVRYLTEGLTALVAVDGTVVADPLAPPEGLTLGFHTARLGPVSLTAGPSTLRLTLADRPGTIGLDRLVLVRTE